MPLNHSSSDTAFKQNVKTLMGEVGQSPHVQSRAQALAIAYETKRRGRADGGATNRPLDEPVNLIDRAVTAVTGRRFPERALYNATHGPLGGEDPERVQRQSHWNQTETGIISDRVPRGDHAGGLVSGLAGGGFTQGSSWQERSAARQLMHSGPINSAVPGRTDRHPITVPSGSYVLPADHVSALGQNNTVAGFKVLGGMFPKSNLRRGPGPPKAPSLPGGLNTAMGRRQPGLTSDAGGARGHDHGEPTDIIVAGGEFGILPEEVAAAGGGDLKKGHAALDRWVLNTRKKHIRTLKGLPPPAKS